MQNITFLLGAVAISWLVGCASTPIVLPPVGPNPERVESKAAGGKLQVFSSLIEEGDDQNQGNNGDPVWLQHSDYSIYDLNGKRVEHVGNTVGHYDPTPRPVALPPGRYLVKAQSNDYLVVIVPVVIRSGQTTRVHLDDNWKPNIETSAAQVVSLPDGNLVGWRIGFTNKPVTN